MTLAYGPANLPGLDFPGTDHSYVNRIPASDILAGDLYTTLTLKGPSSGQTRIQSMWIGHPAGSGLSFDGDQVQVLLAGATSFTLVGAGLVTLDPVAFELDDTKDLLVAYRLLGGDTYSYNGSVAAGYNQAWKAGTEDPGITTKTGYIDHFGRTSIVSGINVAATDDTSEPVEESCCDHGLSTVLAGEVYSAGGEVGISGSRLHFMLMNPAASGRNGFVHQIIVTPNADTVASVRRYQTPLATPLPDSNLMLGSAPAAMTLTYSFDASLLGDIHSIFKLRGGEPYKINAPFPLFGLAPGEGVLLAIHQPNVGATCNFEWQEQDI